MKIIGCYKSELGDYWLFYNPKFEFSHLSDGAGKSFAPRLKVKGKAELSDGRRQFDIPVLYGRG